MFCCVHDPQFIIHLIEVNIYCSIQYIQYIVFYSANGPGKTHSRKLGLHLKPCVKMIPIKDPIKDPKLLKLKKKKNRIKSVSDR